MTCTGKRAFASHQHAELAARKGSQAHDCAMHAYRCGRCHAWHVGGQMRPKHAITQAKRAAIHALYRNDDREE